MYRLLPPLVLMANLAFCAIGRAGLEADPPQFEAGEVHAGAALTHRFTLINRGSEPVEIVEVRPSCGCVTATPDRRRFGPGETGSLLLEANTVTQPGGPASWRVTLRCRSGERDEETILTLTARVQVDLSLEPSALVVETDGAVNRTVTLTDRRESAMTVRVETTCPQVRATADAPTRAGAAWTYAIHLDAAADLAEGRHDEVLHMYTSDAEYADLKLPFTIVKRGKQRVTASPATVELSTGSPSRLVLLRGGDGEEVEIEAVECDSAAVHCEWAAGARPTAAVRVRLDAAMIPPDGVKTTVHLRLGKPAPQTVDVPVICGQR